MSITVYSFHRIGIYKTPEQAYEAALDYSRDTDNIATIEYADGRYHNTVCDRHGNWGLGPIFRPMTIEEYRAQEAAE